MQQFADMLISNGIVLTMNPDNTMLENGAVAVADGKILAVGPARDFAGWQVSRTIDAKGGIIMPGLVNTHTHAAMTCFRGIADDLPLMTWLNEYIFPAEACLTKDRVHAGAMLACGEMILSGTTTFCDMYLFEDAVAQAAKTAGMRAVVGEVLFDFPSPNYGPVEQGLAYSADLIAQWKGDPLIRIAVEPHSPYLCAPDLLRKAYALTDAGGLLFIMHVSETHSEVAQIRERYGKTPVAHLADIGVLRHNLLACHCVALNDHDIDLLKQYDVKVSHNPESNMKLASGVAPIPQMLSAGICVGIGTDGCSSNNNLDMFSEMDMAAKIHKVNALDPTVMNARTTLRMCTIEAARALGLDSVTGSLEPGKAADLIVIDTFQPHLMPMYNPESHLVYSVRGGDVVLTVINGQVVMENREIKTFDLQKAMADVRQIAEQGRGEGWARELF
jgi:5-methylthioadenosine/S-adenosylhomocysteine deaminase